MEGRFPAQNAGHVFSSAPGNSTKCPSGRAAYMGSQDNIAQAK
jgi:hypothetical protein